MIKSLSHITLIVQDLDKSSNMLKYIFDAKEIYDSGEKTFSISPERFFLIGKIWVVLMLWEPLKTKTYNHIAFKILAKDFDSYLSKIQELWVEIKESRPRLKWEWKSIYFYDYDNHLFELHTSSLKSRLKQYLK